MSQECLSFANETPSGNGGDGNGGGGQSALICCGGDNGGGGEMAGRLSYFGSLAEHAKRLKGRQILET